jgi:hypothetical protein
MNFFSGPRYGVVGWTSVELAGDWCIPRPANFSQVKVIVLLGHVIRGRDCEFADPWFCAASANSLFKIFKSDDLAINDFAFSVRSLRTFAAKSASPDKYVIVLC